jgi:hypothetical protein
MFATAKAVELKPSRLPGGTRNVGGDDRSRVPVQAAAGPARASRSALVKAGWIVASAVDGAAVVIEHPRSD